MDYFKNALAFSTPKTTSIDAYNERMAKSPPPNSDNSRRSSLVLPIYIYDCSLSLLVDALVEKLDRPRFRDIQRDHTFRPNDQYREEFISMKAAESAKPPSPEPKSEDSDNVTSGELLKFCNFT